MPRTLIISSETPDEDLQAAFTIVKEAESDQRLDSIKWYSNMGKSLSVVHGRMDKLESDFKDIQKGYLHIQKSARESTDRSHKAEGSVDQFTKDIKLLKDQVAKILKELKDTKKEEAPKKSKAPKEVKEEEQ